MGLRIVGTGHFVPGEPVLNAQLARVMDTNDEWIQKRTGIQQRHFARVDEGVSDLAKEATERAIENANIDRNSIDYIVFATMTPEYPFPGPGGLLGAKIGIPGVPALDIRQQCASIPFGLQLADSLILSGVAKRILLVGADTHASFLPWEDWDVLRGTSDREVSEAAFARGTKHRGVSVLFGDGAAAMILEGGGEGGIIASDLHTDGRHFDHIYLPGGGFIRESEPLEDAMVPRMRGRDLFKFAVTHLEETVRTVCDKAGISVDDIDLFVAHQANDRINDAVRKALGVPAEKVPSNIARFGNTSAATIGILMDELRRDGVIKSGQLLCILALGSGTSWGSLLLRT